MHDHRSLRSFRETQEMPGVLALFENAIFNYTAPIIRVKYGERIAHFAIGQIHLSPAFGYTILPAPDDDNMDAFPHFFAPLAALLFLHLPLTLVTVYVLNT